MNANLKFARPLAAIGLLALLGAAPAYAADAVSEEPPVPAAPMEEPPVASWAGPYAGISLGLRLFGHHHAGDRRRRH